MKLIAMLSWFDEDPELLEECISRVRALGVDHLVAVDGPYDLYPAERQQSPYEPFKAILDASAGIGVTMRNKASWSGNEVEKRNFMLGLALGVADRDDWLLVVDSDHMWEARRSDDLPLKMLLEMTTLDFAEVSISDEAPDVQDPHTYPARLLMRAIPGMRYDGAHYRIRLPDGRKSLALRTEAEESTATALDLHDRFLVRHLVFHLSAERRDRQTIYYRGRDGGGVES